ncbi:MAG: MBL fold metallo-hydrolase, partial [Pseudomonadales bacterium]|nr:MBL fold metallo-hydrolase [Pseudomonadales bacterium]
MGEKLFDRDIGPMTILFGVENGKYPQGNSLLIQGGDKTVMIDPCLGIISRNSYLPHVDEIFLTHVHEDH